MRYVTHGPQIQQKTTVKKVFDELKKPINSMLCNKFRANNDVMLSSLLYQHYALTNNLAQHSFDTLDDFIDVPVADWCPDLPTRFGSILSSPPKWLCVNNATKNRSEKSLTLLREFLDDFMQYAFITIG